MPFLAREWHLLGRKPTGCFRHRRFKSGRPGHRERARERYRQLRLWTALTVARHWPARSNGGRHHARDRPRTDPIIHPSCNFRRHRRRHRRSR
jgi:hypothetical protein